MKRKMTRCITMMMTALMLTTVCAPATYAETYLKGDVNADGKVNLTDAKMSLRMALGIDRDTPEAIMYGDINGDGKLNLADVKEILRGALGITELGTGETDDGADDNTGTDVHTHDYKPVYTTVPEKGHWETVTVKPAYDEVINEAWDESIKDTAYICNGCGKMFSLSEYGSSSNAKAAHTAHVYVDKCSGGYHTDEFTTTIHHDAEIVHHDAVTEQKWFVDQNAEQVIDHYECSCGAKEDSEPEQNASASVVKYGDVDSDGSVNSIDALEVLRHNVGLKTLNKDQLVAADVNGDDSADANDALLILQHTVGLIDKFPIEDGMADYEEPLTITEDSYICNYCSKEFKISDYSTEEMIDALIGHLSDELMKISK